MQCGISGFQYHPGSINANIVLHLLRKLIVQFQYHPGSINAEGTSKITVGKHCFNTILVRLML